MTAAAIVPNLPARQADRLLTQLKIPAGDRSWVNALRGKDLHNGALVALDYRTGDVLAYIGSAGYSRDDLASRKFAPKYDAAGDGLRQPGSAFKPILYTSAFDNERLTPGAFFSMSRRSSMSARTGRPTTPISWTVGLSSSARRFSTPSTCRRSAPCNGSGTRRSHARPTLSGFDSSEATRHSCRRGSLERSARSRCGRSTSSRRTAASPTAACTSRRGRSSRSSVPTDDVWQASDPTRQTGRLPASRLPDDRHPGRKHGPEPEPDLVRQTRVEERPARDAPAGRSEDRHVERSDRSLDVRVPAAARMHRPSTHSRSASGWATATTRSEDRDARDVTDGGLRRCGTPSSRDYTSHWPVAQFKPPAGVVRATIDAWSGGAPGPVDASRRRRPGSSPARNLGLATRSTPTGFSTRRAARGGGSTSSRRSSALPPGTMTSQAGWTERGADPASSGRMAPRQRSSGGVPTGAGRSTGRVRPFGHRRRPSTGRQAASFMSHHRATRLTTPRRDTAPNRHLPRPRQSPRPRQNPRRRRHRSRPQSRNRRRHKVRRLMNGTKARRSGHDGRWMGAFPVQVLQAA